MPEAAHVTSVEVLETFKTHLIVYLSKARPTLGEVSAEVMRTRQWLENDQRMHWEGQVKRRLRRLEDARQALFGARIASLRDETTAEQQAVRKAKQSLEEAEAKLKMVKYWTREFEHRVEPMVKQLERLETLLASDLPAGIAYLAQASKALSAYTEAGPTATGPAAVEPDPIQPPATGGNPT